MNNEEKSTAPTAVPAQPAKTVDEMKACSDHVKHHKRCGRCRAANAVAIGGLRTPKEYAEEYAKLPTAVPAATEAPAGQDEVDQVILPRAEFRVITAERISLQLERKVLLDMLRLAEIRHVNDIAELERLREERNEMLAALKDQIANCGKCDPSGTFGALCNVCERSYAIIAKHESRTK